MILIHALPLVVHVPDIVECLGLVRVLSHGLAVPLHTDPMVDSNAKACEIMNGEHSDIGSGWQLVRVNRES